MIHLRHVPMLAGRKTEDVGVRVGPVSDPRPESLNHTGKGLWALQRGREWSICVMCRCLLREKRKISISQTHDPKAYITLEERVVREWGLRALQRGRE